VRQVNVVVKVTSDRPMVGNLAGSSRMGEAGIDSRTIQPQGVSRASYLVLEFWSPVRCDAPIVRRDRRRPLHSIVDHSYDD